MSTSRFSTSMFYVFFMVSAIFLKSILFVCALLFFDSLSCFIFCIFPLVAFFLFATPYLGSLFSEKLLYSLSFLLMYLLLLSSFISNKVFLFLISVESLNFFLMYLVLYFSKDYDKISSVLFMFSFNMMGSAPFMVFSLSSDSFFISLDFFSFSSFFLSSFLLFSFLMLALKLPIFLAHVWLTKVHVASLGSISMILASLILKAGSFGLLKFFSLFFYCSGVVSQFFSFSLLTLIFFSFFMLRFFDLKTLVACSSVSHMALVLPSCLMKNSLGLFSSALMVVFHGLVSYFLFFLVSLLYEHSLSRSFLLNKSFKKGSSGLFLSFVFFMLLNLGCPPFSGFVCELYLFCMVYYFSLFMSFWFFSYLILNSFYFIFLLILGTFPKSGSGSYFEGKNFASFLLFVKCSFFIPLLSF